MAYKNFKMENAREILLREKTSFQKNLNGLMKNYKDQWIAYSGGKVLDHDRDRSELLLRVYSKLNGKPTLIAKVAYEEEPRSSVPSVARKY